jgi:hypothetical protein
VSRSERPWSRGGIASAGQGEGKRRRVGVVRRDERGTPPLRAPRRQGGWGDGGG